MVALCGMRPTADRCGVGQVILGTSRPLWGVRNVVYHPTAAGGKSGHRPLDRCEGLGIGKCPPTAAGG